MLDWRFGSVVGSRKKPTVIAPYDRRGLKSLSQIRLAETDLGQLEEPGKATKVVGRLTGVSSGLTRAQGVHSFQGVPFLSERRADRGTVTGSAEVGWRSQMLCAAEGWEAGREKARPWDHKHKRDCNPGYAVIHHIYEISKSWGEARSSTCKH